MPIMFRGDSTVNSAVGGSLEDISDEIVLDGFGQEVALYLKNTHGSAALTNLTMLVKVDASADWVTVLTGTAWRSVAGIVLGIGTSAGNLDTLAAGAVGTAILKVGPVYSVKFQAVTGSSGSTSLIAKVRCER